jgi:hypothetical protein
VEQNYLLQMKNLIQDVVGHHFGHLWPKRQLWNYLIIPSVKKELKFVVPRVDHTWVMYLKAKAFPLLPI